MKIIDSLFLIDGVAAAGDEIRIEGEEARHVLQVRRMKRGDTVFVTNGKGLCAKGDIAQVGERNRYLVVNVQQTIFVEKPQPEIILASAVLKGERQGMLLNMATQLGMNAFIPLQCDFSAVTYQAKMSERWARIIVTASKQCRQCNFPEIRQPVTLDSLLQDVNRRDTAIALGDVEGMSSLEIPRKLAEQWADREISSVVLIVGPEGGFSARENQLIAAQNSLKSLFFKLRLSRQILRTETAAVALLAVVNQLGWPMRQTITTK